jgi:hypothetical protein
LKKVQGRSKSSKSVLFISDMHVGNQTAICSPNPKMNGGSYNPNKLQKQLYERWCEIRDKCHNPHILCLNGEPCDGSNVKQSGAQEWSTVIREQLDDATKLLKMYHPKYLLMTRGSNYHVQLGGDNQEEILAERLNAVPYSGLFDVEKDTEHEQGSIRTDYFVTFRVNDKVFSATHHIGFNRWFAYRTTAIAREMADMEFMRGRYWRSEDMPSVIVRSHAHYFVYVRFATQHGFITPAWKFPDGHLFRGGLGGTAPSIGTVEVIVEPNGEIQVLPHIVSNIQYPKHNILDLSE